MVDQKSDEVLDRLIKFIPELAEEIKIENEEVCITPAGIKLRPKLLGEIFRKEDC